MSANTKVLKEKPEAIMINIPEAFFLHDGKVKGRVSREIMFRKFYESMGTSDATQNSCFYHFISSIPVHPVECAYICFNGRVQYRAIIVEFLRDQPVMLPDYEHPEPRDWMVTTGPVVKAPFEIPQKGFRGFRYTNHLF